ncbi:hypothetical protein [Paramagnetospirillum marisnigri]|nr:hypothetical protein [Paramagnetospirillum marisnigri]
MTPSKKSFLKSLQPKAQNQNWRVSMFGWQCEPDGTVSGEVVDAIETNELGLAIMAAHRLLDLHAPQMAQLITLEIAATDLIEGGQI